MPAQKKDSSVRRRANRASTAATLSRDHDVETPSLPAREDGWHQLTAEWWRDIWASPMSPEWDASDLHGMYVLAAVYDDIWTASSPTARKEAAGEYRLQRKDFGLTPYDRRRLEWTIEQADEAKDRGRRRRETPTPTPVERKGDDPRSALRAV